MIQKVNNERQAKVVLTTLQNGVLTITLNRPERLNAMTPQMIDELREAITNARKNKEARAIVITGAGKAFCAGGDIREDIEQLGKMTLSEWRKYHGTSAELYQWIFEIEKPVIAAVNGVALGGGCDLANVCDIRVASEDAKFGMGYIKMGITPGVGGTYYLPRQICPGMAKLLIFTGDIIDAKEAKEIGLVEKVVARDKFEAEVKDLAQKLANGPTIAMGSAKVAINKSYEMNLPQTLKYMTESQYPLFKTKDYKEAYTAFLEKRKPIFKGE